MMKRLSLVCLTMCVLLFSTIVSAENSKRFGEHTVYYNAFTSDSIRPAIARIYKITRSKNRGLLSVSVLKNTPSPMGSPVKAKVTANATNLTGQLKNIDIREIEDGTSVYYVSEFHISHKEVLDFTLEIQPEGSQDSVTLKFRQQFYTQ